MDLDRAFERLAGEPDLDAGLLARIRAWIADAEDADVFRINLVRWSERWGVPLPVAVTHFLHLVRAGVMDLSWEAHCARCNGVLERTRSLKQARRGHRCSYCDRVTDARLDDHFEVTFTVSPEVRVMAVSPRYLPSRNMRVLLSERVAAGEKVRFSLHVPASAPRLRMAAWQPFVQRLSAIGASGEAPVVRVLSSEEIFLPEVIPAGDVALAVTNESAKDVSILIETDELRDYDPDEREPRLTGLMVALVPAFRELFGGETLSDRESLGVRDVTIAFTDIQGSTALYQRAGEAAAYNLVRDHFDVLFEAIARNGGVVVKTIGDAVMAAFERPALAVRALLEAQEEFARWGGDGVRPSPFLVRAGVHRGPALSVTLNERLDFFGTTVNEAARMESACGGGEMVLSDAVMRAEGVAELLGARRVEPFVARFKGLAGDYACHRVHRAGG
jgi:class 3 adenylate cyclase